MLLHAHTQYELVGIALHIKQVSISNECCMGILSLKTQSGTIFASIWSTNGNFVDMIQEFTTITGLGPGRCAPPSSNIGTRFLLCLQRIHRGILCTHTYPYVKTHRKTRLYGFDVDFNMP